jgi:hypothetical protein
LGRYGGRWDDNIKGNLREIGWGGTDWISLAQDREKERVLVNRAMNLQAPLNVIKFSSS